MFVKCAEIDTLESSTKFELALLDCNNPALVSVGSFDNYLTDCYGGDIDRKPETFGKIYKDVYIDNINTVHFLVFIRFAQDYKGFAYDIFRKAWL